MFEFLKKAVSKLMIWTLLGLMPAAVWGQTTPAAGQTAGQPAGAPAAGQTSGTAGAPANAAAGSNAAGGQTSAAPKGQEVRLKDIARIEGLKENQLTGLGLVTGLSGQGDSPTNPLLQYVLSSLVGNLGVSLSPEVLKSKNAAVVALSATVPPFVRKGEVIDLQVSSLGDAKSLDGGVLLQTPLMAANGKIYAVGQGRVILAPGKNAPKTSGTVPSGAIVEEEVLSKFVNNSSVSFLLNNPDFSTASEIGKALKAAFPQGKVEVVDSGRIAVTLPEGQNANAVDFISQAENLKVVPDFSARVVVNRASGVVVAGRFVKIAKVAVSVKGAKVTIGSVDKAATTPSSKNKTSEQFVLEESSTVEDLVTTLQRIGLDTDTVIEVLKAVDRAGALYGTLEVL